LQGSQVVSVRLGKIEKKHGHRTFGSPIWKGENTGESSKFQFGIEEV